jgi:hypothetical protein
MVTSPTLGMTTPVSVFVPKAVPIVVKVVAPVIVVGTAKAAVVVWTTSENPVEGATVPWLPSDDHVDSGKVVAKGVVTVAVNVELTVDTVVKKLVLTVVNSLDQVSVVTDTVMLVVKVETEVETGITEAPLGRLTVESLEPAVRSVDGAPVLPTRLEAEAVRLIVAVDVSSGVDWTRSTTSSPELGTPLLGRLLDDIRVGVVERAVATVVVAPETVDSDVLTVT